MGPTSIILTVLGGLIALIVAFVAWRYVATVRGGNRVQSDLLQELEPIWSRLYAGKDPESCDVVRFAGDLRTRTTLFDLLLFHQRLELIPPTYRTKEALAESQLVVWLIHPNELGAPPNEIKLAAEVELSSRHGRKQVWLVFQFCVHSPHWAAKDGWMAGVVGPFPIRSAEVMPAEMVWSMFRPFDSMSPEDHAKACRDLGIKSGMIR